MQGLIHVTTVISDPDLYLQLLGKKLDNLWDYFYPEIGKSGYSHKEDETTKKGHQ